MPRTVIQNSLGILQILKFLKEIPNPKIFATVQPFYTGKCRQLAGDHICQILPCFGVRSPPGWHRQAAAVKQMSPPAPALRSLGLMRNSSVRPPTHLTSPPFFPSLFACLMFDWLIFMSVWSASRLGIHFCILKNIVTEIQVTEITPVLFYQHQPLK